MFFWTQFAQTRGHYGPRPRWIFFFLDSNNKGRSSAFRTFLFYQNIICFDWVMNLFLSWVMFCVKKVSFPAKTAVCHSCHIWTRRGKKMWACLKVIKCRWRKSQKGDSFHREDRFSLCNAAILWNFIATLTGVYTVTDFIGYLFSLYYCCFTCLRLARPKVQLKVS